ncbi:uncharacterized protein SOCEGT47_070920 [Sorangium cellulosum]|uniref:Secreted protein n=1 Tax=Sorangium cellulosum TaxID=56 RepID=A0A4P2QBN9_SORCE|nr:hypothetical protein [Sorangium cellulosum]AUX26523.1 uncharacterized protein SOCEGT47_070920 [Sorangium cellulosum]
MRRSSLPGRAAALLSLSLAAPALAQGEPPPAVPAPPAAAMPSAPVPPAAAPGAPAAPAAPAAPGVPATPSPPTAAPGAPAATAAPSPPSARAIAPIAPASGGSIAPVATGRELVFLLPANVTGGSGGGALARVGFGVLAGFGEVTDPTGWDVSTVLEAEVATQNGLASLIGLAAADDGAQVPSGRLHLSASLARLDFEGKGSSAYPPLIFYLGGSVGRARFNYLGPGPERRDQSLPPTFVRRELIALPWSVGAAAVYITEGWSKLAPTFEGQVAFDSRWTASTDRVSWCEPVGDVFGSVDPDTQTTRYVPASRCKEEVLGAPAKSQELKVTAHLGLVDKVADATFRASFGAKVAVALNDDAPADLHVNLRAPVYVTLARAPKGTKYRGIVRLSPALSIARLSDGKTDIGGMLEISFLGQRTMFSDNYTDL